MPKADVCPECGQKASAVEGVVEAAKEYRAAISNWFLGAGDGTPARVDEADEKLERALATYHQGAAE